MRVGIDAQLSSISAFSTDLKTLEQIKPIGQAAEFKFESKLEPLQVIWQSFPKAYLTRQSKVLTAKSIAELLGPRSNTAWAGRTGKHIQTACRICFISTIYTTNLPAQNTLPMAYLSILVYRVNQSDGGESLWCTGQEPFCLTELPADSLLWFKMYTSNTQTTGIFKFQRRHNNPHEGVQAWSCRPLLLPGSEHLTLFLTIRQALAGSSLEATLLAHSWAALLLFKTHFKRNLSPFKQILGHNIVMSKEGSKILCGVQV